MLGLEVAGDEKRGGKGVGCGYTSMTFSVVFGTQHTRSTMPKLKSVELGRCILYYKSTIEMMRA